MQSLSIDKRILFSAQELKAGDTYEVLGYEIITIISSEVREKTSQLLKKFESSVFYQGNTLTALKDTFISIFTISEHQILLNKIDVDKEFGDFCRNSWKQLRQIYNIEGFEKVDLYRGDQIDYIFEGTKYKLNLWFCGKETDCLFHNQHNFVEIHTNIAGNGYMQKSFDGTDQRICETVGLLPGNSHRKFDIPGEFESNGNPKYPMHRWLGGTTGNIWLVVEQYNNY